MHSMKLTLRKVVGTYVLRREELQTVLLEAASMLNSRPLATIDSVDGGVKPLTPALFLVGSMHKVLPLDPDPDSKTSFGRKWALIEKLYKDLWARWRTKYLQNLQKRVTWKKESSNLRIGDVVLITDSDMPDQWVKLRKFILDEMGLSKQLMSMLMPRLTRGLSGSWCCWYLGTPLFAPLPSMLRL